MRAYRQPTWISKQRLAKGAATRTWNLDEQDAAFEQINLAPDVLIAE
jgi:hypothetical protein